MIAFIGQWDHALAAIAFGLLMVALLPGLRRRGDNGPLALASALTMVWALTVAMLGPQAFASWLTESVRDLGWIGYMLGVWRRDSQRDAREPAVTFLYGVVILVLIGRSVVDLLPLGLMGSPRLLEAIFYAAIVLRMIVAVSALVLVHNLYTATANRSRDAIRLPMLALVMMWGYDLNLYTIAYLQNSLSAELEALRGLLIALLAPLFALGAWRAQHAPVRLSRSATFQSLSLVGVGAYLVLMVGGSALLQVIAPHFVRLFQVSFVFLTALAGAAMLPNTRLRAWVRVMLSKHLFQHRYDYRTEWVRFTNTLSRPDHGTDALNERAIKAIADITESPGGILLAPDAAGGLTVLGHVHWEGVELPARIATATTISYFERTARICEIDAVRHGAAPDAEAAAVPEWLVHNPRAWVIVPLIHFDRLAGLLVLERPMLDRQLDWEDFDLLRIAGRQVASYLAEAKGQQALSDAQRFDEFNRRFAFIMHDIKNLVSQLNLVSRNAERHIANPDFQQDLIATLNNSTRRMNDLLARLSQHNKGKVEEPRAVALGPLVQAVAEGKRAQHPIIVAGETRAMGLADASRLEQAIGHLVQNAIDASAPSDPVTIQIDDRRGQPQIHIIDQGVGMSAAFVRTDLFKPFTSTKNGGFGLGAYEARTLIEAMGGTLSVASQPGLGTSFTIALGTPHSALDAPDLAA